MMITVLRKILSVDLAIGFTPGESAHANRGIMSEYINRLGEARLSARVVRDAGGRRDLLVMW